MIIDVEGLKVNAQVISLVIIVTIGSPKFILLSQANLKHVQERKHGCPLCSGHSFLLVPKYCVFDLVTFTYN